MSKVKQAIERMASLLKIPVEELKEEYKVKLADEKKRHPEWKAEDQKGRAIARLRMTYRRRLTDPSNDYTGIVLGNSSAIDWTLSYRNNALELYNKSPDEALRKGQVKSVVKEDEDGKKFTDIIVMDLRETLHSGKKNRNVGKEYPKNRWISNAFGFCTIRAKGESTPKFFRMTLSGDVARKTVFTDLLNLPVVFKAADSTPKELEDELILRSTSATRFALAEPTEKLCEAIKKDPAFIEKAILSLCAKYVLPLAGLEDFHEENVDNFNRLVIVEGDIVSMRTEALESGSRIITIDDVSLSFEEDFKGRRGVTCWIPEHVTLDFGEESKVYVIGRTNQRKLETGEWGDVQINAYGVWCHPEFKIEAPEPVKETTGETTAEAPPKKDITGDDEPW